MQHIEDYYMKNELNRYREFVNGFIKLESRHMSENWLDNIKWAADLVHYAPSVDGFYPPFRSGNSDLKTDVSKRIKLVDKLHRALSLADPTHAYYSNDFGYILLSEFEVADSLMCLSGGNIFTDQLKYYKKYVEYGSLIELPEFDPFVYKVMRVLCAFTRDEGMSLLNLSCDIPEPETTNDKILVDSNLLSEHAETASNLEKSNCNIKLATGFLIGSMAANLITLLFKH